MREELLEYYERELAHLRQLGGQFAEKYPRVASRLLLEPDRCDDPHVERLLEAFAFMAARVHLRVDDDFPEVTSALLGIVQGIGHTMGAPLLTKTKYPYSPGGLTAALLHVPIGITTIRAMRAQGGIERSDWVKGAAVLGGFLVFCVALPNVLLADKNSPYEFTAHQMGRYKTDEPHAPDSLSTGDDGPNG